MWFLGIQYRSVIFYHDDKQKATTERSKAEVATLVCDDTIVTEITKAEDFYLGAPDHQNYYNEHKSAPYYSIVINAKIAKLRSIFAYKLKKEYV